MLARLRRALRAGWTAFWADDPRVVSWNIEAKWLEVDRDLPEQMDRAKVGDTVLDADGDAYEKIGPGAWKPVPHA